MSSRKIFGLILALMFAWVLIPLDSQALDFVWSRTDDGFWDAPGNWTPNGVPGSAPPREDTVTIDAAPARNVTVLYQGYKPRRSPSQRVDGELRRHPEMYFKPGSG